MLLAILALSGCKKKTVAISPAPPPAPPIPTASISANPEAIELGQSSTLNWQSKNATNVTLEGQPVDANGNRTVSPHESITYHLVAKGPGGTQDAVARVAVVQPPASPQPGPSDEELFTQNIKHISFDYDKYDIRADQQAAMKANAQFLAQHANMKFAIEGHCDERGSIEYNLALGDNRAGSVKNALVQAGVAPDRIRTISFGKEKPFCSESSETCWQQNRRGYFVYHK